MLVLSALNRSLHLIVAAARRVLLLIVWPLVHFVLLPFLIPWHIAALIAFAAVTRSCMTFRVESISQPNLWLEFLTTLGLLFIAAFLIAGALVGAGVIAPQAKLMADVIRYLGLPSYRNGLHARLRAFITDLGLSRSNRVFLIAHSLGSVIVVDFLSDSGCPLDPNSDICLITLGSPLRRFLARFFGQVYPQPTELARWIRARFHRFVWINIFRPLDYVGGRLTVPDCDIQNICTGERTRFHTVYWGDGLVAEMAKPCYGPEVPLAPSMNQLPGGAIPGFLMYPRDPRCLDGHISWS
jgi:hypothetical protein